MQQSPIFIVGVPRSGTTLLSALIAAHSGISCGPETHFFRWLSQTDPGQFLTAGAWPERAVEFVCSISRTSFFGDDRTLLIDSYDRNRQQIDAYLRAAEPSVANMLASVTEPYALAAGKRRWAEKTPDHLQYLSVIREHFPSAPIVRIVRDPRDVARSLMRMPWGTRSFLEGLLLWRRLDEASAEFFAADDNCYTLRYEDLIASPEGELQALCKFVDEEYEDGMLNTADTGRQLNSRNVPWKAGASQPIDGSRVAMWQDALGEDENVLAEAILGDRLQLYGYPTVAQFAHFGKVYPERFDVVKFGDCLKHVAADGVRFWSIDDGERPSVRVFVGDPGNDGWIGEGRMQRAAEALSLSAEITRARLTDTTVYWTTVDPVDGPCGRLAGVLRWLLKPYQVMYQVAEKTRIDTIHPEGIEAPRTS